MYTLFHHNRLRTRKARIGHFTLHYNITVTESTFTKIKHAPQLLVKNSCTGVNENRHAFYALTLAHRQTDGRTAVVTMQLFLTS